MQCFTNSLTDSISHAPIHSCTYSIACTPAKPLTRSAYARLDEQHEASKAWGCMGFSQKSARCDMNKTCNARRCGFPKQTCRLNAPTFMPMQRRTALTKEKGIVTLFQALARTTHPRSPPCRPLPPRPALKRGEGGGMRRELLIFARPAPTRSVTHPLTDLNMSH